MLRFSHVAHGVCLWRRRSLRFARHINAALIALLLLRRKQRRVPVAPSLPLRRSSHDGVAHCFASLALHTACAFGAVCPCASLAANGVARCLASLAFLASRTFWVTKSPVRCRLCSARHLDGVTFYDSRIPRTRISPHCGRVWLACALLAAGHSTATIQAMCRWLSPAAVRIYAHMNPEVAMSTLDSAIRPPSLHGCRQVSLRAMLTVRFVPSVTVELGFRLCWLLSPATSSRALGASRLSRRV